MEQSTLSNQEFRPRALLIDLFDTLVAADFAAIESELADYIGCTRADLIAQLAAAGPLMTSATAYERFFAQLFASIGRPGTVRDIADVMDLDRELLVKHSAVLEDARALVDDLRSRAIPIALISNCAPNARAVVDHFGISDWVDEVVLSCDVGVTKPDAAIFRLTCARLGVAPHEAAFIDDQAKYCVGAATLGIESYWVVRDGSAPAAPVVTGPAAVRVIESCLDLVSPKA
jgi:putative hydrolase of the HAD superfamily